MSFTFAFTMTGHPAAPAASPPSLAALKIAYADLAFAGIAAIV
jgi:hypothetical protein